MEVTYKQIYQALFSEGIEEYVPDGTSISHPIVHTQDGSILDCFLLYGSSLDGSKYTVPTARIVIDTEKKKLVEYKTAEEKPFIVYSGVDYFEDDTEVNDMDATQLAEMEYQSSYIEVRKIAFKENVTDADKKKIVRYIKALKSVERVHLQPFLFELGEPFFEWIKTKLK